MAAVTAALSSPPACRARTMKGIHLCAVRVSLLRRNPMPAMNWHFLEDVKLLQHKNEHDPRDLGRLPVPMVRHRERQGLSADFRETRLLPWLQADCVRPTRNAWRGRWHLGVSAYYTHQKVARFLETNHVDTRARVLPCAQHCCVDRDCWMRRHHLLHSE